MTVIRKDQIPKCRNICPCTLDGLAAVIWPNYCRYGVEIYPINQSIDRLYIGSQDISEIMKGKTQLALFLK